MSLTGIEAELAKLGPEDLRKLALKSWSAFVRKEADGSKVNKCSEGDSRVLAARDEAIAKADLVPGGGHPADAIRARLDAWTAR